MKLNRAEEKIIAALLKAKGRRLDIWQLSRKCGYLLDVIRSAEFLRKIKAVRIKDSVVYLVNRNKLPKYMIKKERPLKDVMKRYINYRKQIVFASDELDQLSILPKAVENKLSVMLRENDLLNRDILCIGDDDLFSVACSLTGLPKSITVFDIDERIINFISKISSRLPVPIKVVNLNLLKTLPKQYRNVFDVFITEPPDTVKGTLLFISRGIQALRKNGVFYLGMTGMTLNKKQWFQIEQVIMKSGIAFTDIIQDFEEYALDPNNELAWKGFEKLPKWVNKAAKKPWFVSTLFRGEIVGKKEVIRLSFKDVRKELITSLLP